MRGCMFRGAGRIAGRCCICEGRLVVLLRMAAVGERHCGRRGAADDGLMIGKGMKRFFAFALAALVLLSRYRGRDPFCDPFCGSGTLLIEAAQKAMNIAPGLKRRFAAERYGFVPAAIWAEQRQKALAEAKLDVGFEAFGYDIDPAAVALANANAKLAGVEKRSHFEVADVADFAAKQEAIVLTNPPYGERMSTIEGAAKLARTLGRQMEAHPCAGVYAITADMDFETHYGKRANKRRKMYNGMIPCQLYMYYSAPKFEHTAKPMPKSGFDGKRTAPNRFNKK